MKNGKTIMSTSSVSSSNLTAQFQSLLQTIITSHTMVCILRRLGLDIMPDYYSIVIDEMISLAITLSSFE